jgi:hypothetical protein
MTVYRIARCVVDGVQRRAYPPVDNDSFIPSPA